MTETLEAETRPDKNGGQRYRQVRRQMTDEHTGETRSMIIDEPIVARRRASDQRSAEAFVIAYPEALAELGPTLKWTALWLLMADWPMNEPTFRYSNNDLADRMGVSAARANEAIRGLEQDGLARRVKRGTIRINPHIFWRGGSGRRLAAMHDWKVSTPNAA